MANLWQKFTKFDGNGWWNLPHGPANELNPPYEGPIGGAWFGNLWRTLTYGGVTHGTPKFYWLIGAILAVITLVEVWLFDLEGLGGWYIPILLILSAGKFVAVVAYFMHLRFDDRLYTYFFTAAMIVGILIFSLILVLAEYAHQPVLF
ncbi:cytochrome C oxidase subunit IV family protein [Dehalococcoides mccartyi]|nr:cytochrome C oxidase subunit IV family protein [Dehalococcoides mccartyi]